MRVGVCAALLAAVLVAGAGTARAKDIVVGVEDLDYYPVYAMWDNEYVGAAREIFDSFAAAKGHRIVYRALPVKRLFAELLAGGVDAKFPDNPHWTVEGKEGHKVAYSRPVITYVDGVMVPPGGLGRGVASIRILGTVSGFTPIAWLGRIQSGSVQVKENPKLTLLLKQAALKRTDGAYASVAVAHHYLDRVLAMPGALVFDPSLPHSRDHYHLSSVAHPELVAEFDAWLAANKTLVADIKARFQAERGVE